MSSDKLPSEDGRKSGQRQGPEAPAIPTDRRVVWAAGPLDVWAPGRSYIQGATMEFQPNERDYTLGFIVENPGLLEGLDIPEGFFRTDSQRGAWTTVRELIEAGQTVSLAMIAERASGNGTLGYINAITSGLYPIKPGEFRRRVYKQAAEDVKKRMQSLAAQDLPDLDELASLIEEARRLDLEAESASGNPADILMSRMISGAAMQSLGLQVEWTIESLLPARSITVLHSRSGLGKTWLCLQAGKAVSEGAPIFNLTTKKRPVFYVDYENPLPLLVERTRCLDVRDVNFWHLSAALKPPKLDSPDWTLYKQLPSGSLIIIDTARACHDGDENSSQDVGLVMGRLKEIRELGQTIVLQHHSNKLDERGYKGSTAWVDLADNVLSLHRVRRGTLEEIDDGGSNPDALFSLGTGAKTRFAPASIYLRFNPTRDGFSLAEDPDTGAVSALADYISGPGQGKSQSEIIAWAKEEMGVGMRSRFLAMLARGEREGRWRSHPAGRKRIYEPAT